MLDEAQDSNPVTLAILRAQSCPVILVGDTYQSIYQFRGAVNALASVKADRVLPLTTSFRFGPCVAQLANALLWAFHGESTEIIGAGPATAVCTGHTNTRNEQVAFLARTNAEIFSHAVQTSGQGLKLGFAGGISSYGFNKIVDAWYLSSGQRELVHDSEIRSFQTYAVLSDYALESGDVEMSRLVKVVDTYGDAIPAIIDRIKAQSTSDLSRAQVVLSTAHRSKGLTLAHVQLADDFPSIIDELGIPLSPEHLDRQEINLLYVAATRASHSLRLNTTLTDFLRSTHCTGLISKPGTAVPTTIAPFKESKATQEPKRFEMPNAIAAKRAKLAIPVRSETSPVIQTLLFY